MSKKDELIEKGVIDEVHPNNIYKIKKEDGSIVRAYMSGKMRKFRINVLIGDKVEFVVDTMGDNNRIIKRI